VAAFEQACKAGQPGQALQLYRGGFLEGCFVSGGSRSWIAGLPLSARASRSWRSGRRLTWRNGPSEKAICRRLYKRLDMESPSILTTRLRSRASSPCWTGPEIALAR